MTLADLLKDQGIDPKMLLRQQIGGCLKPSGGIVAKLEDGFLDIRIVCQASVDS